jgi:thiamine biosynthesis lipoprotein
MASPCEVLLEGADVCAEMAVTLVNLAAQEAWRIEQKFSRYRSDNIIARIHANAGKPLTVDEETADLLDYADRCFHLSGGKFDISSGPLRKVWQFRGQEFSPDQEQLRTVLTAVGWHKCLWQRPQLTVPYGAEIDLGGIGKEYAVDRTVRLLRDANQEVNLLVNFGGDIACSGPRTGGKPWSIGLEKAKMVDTTHDSAADSVIPLRQGGIATSGDTHRFLFYKGERLSHILDPQTGWPVRGAPHTVTVLAPSCTLAGMLATFAMLKGVEAEGFLTEQGFPFWVQRG